MFLGREARSAELAHPGNLLNEIKQLNLNLMNSWYKFKDLSNKYKNVLTPILISGTGFVFGLATAIGLGLNRPASFVIALLVSVGVVISGSLVSYLVTQTILLSFFAMVSYVVFRIIPDFSTDVFQVQVAYAVLIVTGPLIARIPLVRNALSGMNIFLTLQLVASLMFAILVRTIRLGRPSDANYALSQMYLAEDNAGVIAVLSSSLERGYSSHASLFGEFFNGIYVAVAGLLTWFGNPSDQGLLSALTHWNITTLFMAWVPIAALCALIFSGIKLGNLPSLILMVTMSAASVLLFWPFANLGHTSVISSGLMAMCLVALTLNRSVSIGHPVFLFVITLSLSFIVATTWFPFMPFAAATVALMFISILQMQAPKKDKRTLYVLVILLVSTAIALLPEILDRVTTNSSYLQMAGGTRSVSEFLLFAWLGSLGAILWRLSTRSSSGKLIGRPLFALTIGVLLASTMFLFVTGIATNSGNPGYGASKYLLTVISFTTPLLWLNLVTARKKFNYPKVLSSSLVLLFVIVAFQFDTRAIASSFVIPPQLANVQVAQSGVFLALEEALRRKPDQIFCVSDYGIPAPGGELNMNSYSCTRWGQSLVGDEKGQEWRFVPLGRISEESLIPVLEAYRDKKVIIVRFSDPGKPLLVADTWWFKYTDESWDIISVR
jgi:hypothetical protein